MKEKKNFHVLTGGPGSGKTTVINGLREKGYTCVSETGRKIIREQTETSGDAVPWKNAKEYSKLMLQYSVRDYIRAEEGEDLQFFDRGIPDILGYERLINLPIDEKLIRCSEEYRYNPKVFIFPPWKEIYCTDSERKQDMKTAVDTYEMMKKTYAELGYNLIEVPCADVIIRIEFILNECLQGLII